MLPGALLELLLDGAELLETSDEELDIEELEISDEELETSEEELDISDDELDILEEELDTSDELASSEEIDTLEELLTDETTGSTEEELLPSLPVLIVTLEETTLAAITLEDAMGEILAMDELASFDDAMEEFTDEIALDELT